MRIIKKHIKVFVMLCLILALLVLLSFFVGEQSNELTYSYSDNLRHERSYSSKYSLTNFSEEEAKQIITAFGIIIPETEKDITVHSFTQVDLNGIGKQYVVEVDNISDRKALYDANNNTQKPEKLYLPLMWNSTNSNGEYRYYFCFTTLDYYPLDGYVSSVSQLYEMFSKQLLSSTWIRKDQAIKYPLTIGLLCLVEFDIAYFGYKRCFDNILNPQNSNIRRFQRSALQQRKSL